MMDGIDYFKKHLEIIEVFLPIKFTDKEKDLLSYVMFNTDDYVLKQSVKNAIRKKFNLSSQMLYNITRSLKNKGALIEIDERLVIVSTIIPNKKNQKYEFFITVGKG